jgi:hypothetical protein
MTAIFSTCTAAAKHLGDNNASSNRSCMVNFTAVTAVTTNRPKHTQQVHACCTVLTSYLTLACIHQHSPLNHTGTLLLEPPMLFDLQGTPEASLGPGHRIHHLTHISNTFIKTTHQLQNRTHAAVQLTAAAAQLSSPAACSRLACASQQAPHCY